MKGTTESSGNELLIWRRDYEQLTALVEKSMSPEALALEDELLRARILDEKPEGAVAMHAHVKVRDLDTQEEFSVTLVYPHEADFATRKISVLSPVGSALIGLGEGSSIVWPMPGGKHRRLEVLKVENQ